jgi:L-cystine uptake protein TcyP (sodium:dicarboxylate symporter family)
MFASFAHFVDVAHVIVMRMVTLVLRLTPYGVFALITQVRGQLQPAGHPAPDRLRDGFVQRADPDVLVHLLIVSGAGLNPVRYVKKILPVLTFAFTSRTSAGAIPMSVQTQTAAPRHARKASPTSPPRSAPPSARTAAPAFIRPCWR